MQPVVVKLRDGEHTYAFVCENAIEMARAQTLFTKEEGTIRWLRATVKPGDVFYDIGANIGLYTVVAAKLGARVVAFEPHVANARTLLANIARNALTETVAVYTCALSDRTGFAPFYYRSKAGGSSGHQLDTAIGEDGQAFDHSAVEMKYATRADEIVALPTIVKLDVDGNEWRVLDGMDQSLASVRSLQVEVEPQAPHRKTERIFAGMQAHGFTFQERHYTLNGQAQIARGADPEQIAHNVIFGRA